MSGKVLNFSTIPLPVDVKCPSCGKQWISSKHAQLVCPICEAHITVDYELAKATNNDQAKDKNKED